MSALALNAHEYMVDVAEDVQLHVRRKSPAGARPTWAALLVHGSGVGAGCWDIAHQGYSAMEFLAGRGIDVYAVDQRNYGRSSTVPGRSVGAKTAAVDLEAVLRFIESTSEASRVGVVGHSWGGTVALIAAAEYPRAIDRLVLIGTPYMRLHPDFAPAVAASIQLADQGVEALPSDYVDDLSAWTDALDERVSQAYATLVRGTYPSCPIGVLLDYADPDFDLYVKRVRQPTLLLVGLHENVVDLQDAIRMLEELACTDKQLYILGRSRHLVFIEREAYQPTYSAVVDWLHD